MTNDEKQILERIGRAMGLGDKDGPGAWGSVPYPWAILAEIRKAVEAEREACAKVADARAEDQGGCGCSTAEYIAITIRERGRR